MSFEPIVFHVCVEIIDTYLNMEYCGLRIGVGVNLDQENCGMTVL